MTLFKYRLEALGISQALFSSYFCYDKGAVSRWASGVRDPAPYALRTIELLEQGKIDNPAK